MDSGLRYLVVKVTNVYMLMRFLSLSLLLSLSLFFFHSLSLCCSLSLSIPLSRPLLFHSLFLCIRQVLVMLNTYRWLTTLQHSLGNSAITSIDCVVYCTDAPANWLWVDSTYLHTFSPLPILTLLSLSSDQKARGIWHLSIWFDPDWSRDLEAWRYTHKGPWLVGWPWPRVIIISKMNLHMEKHGILLPDEHSHWLVGLPLNPWYQISKMKLHEKKHGFLLPDEHSLSTGIHSSFECLLSKMFR